MDRLSKNELMVILDQQLQSAQNIQKKIIPKPQTFQSDYYHFFAYLKPFRRVGGDFYDFHIFDDDQVSLILADTTGHGLDAAMITSMVKLIYTYGMKDPELRDSPSKLLGQLDQDIEAQLSSSFFSSFDLRLDPHRQELLYSNAGHPAGLLVHGNEVEELNPTLPLIGMHQIMSMVEYKDQRRDFGEGDKLIIFTDGLIDAKNVNDEEYGILRVIDIIRDRAEKPIPEICGAILDGFREYTEGTTSADDICLLGLEYDDMSH